ncbi:hypothetical protein ACJZ2D_014429 [Fusarium nematophilum]
MASSNPPRWPPYVPSLLPGLEGMAIMAKSFVGNFGDLETVKQIRKHIETVTPQIKDAVHSNSLGVEERVVPGPRGDIPVVIVRPAARPSEEKSESGQPGIICYHGGAMVSGNAHFGLKEGVSYLLYCSRPSY